ncbi:MAG: MBL fold metallo-hydrolase [Campylobacterales bacterium]
MSTVRMLGAYGGRDRDKATTSLLVNDSVAIDAGNLLNPLGREARKIDHIFLTHCHMDHLIDLPFLIDAFFAERTRPLNVYGLPHTLQMIKQHILNGDIWPDFNEINLLNGKDKSMHLIEIAPDKPYVVAGVVLTPFETNHTVPSVGFVIEKEGSKLMFTSDTYKCPRVWELLNADMAIKTLIIETSFPSRLDKLAELSRHLTPKLLDEELSHLKRRDVKVYINHFKPDFIEALKTELAGFERTKETLLLDDGVEVTF